MGWLKYLAIAVCVWGTTSFASLPGDTLGGERQQLQSLTSWMAGLDDDTADLYKRMGELNNEFRGINVDVATDLDTSDILEQARTELQRLDLYLRRALPLAPRELILLSCSNIVCGGKGN